MRGKIIFALFGIFVYLLFFFDNGGVIGYMVFDIPKLSLEIINMDTHLEKNEDCYVTIQGVIENEGNGYAYDPSVVCNVLDREGRVLGKETIGFEEIVGRDSNEFTMRMETECFRAMTGQQYSCEVSCSNC